MGVKIIVGNFAIRVKYFLEQCGVKQLRGDGKKRVFVEERENLSLKV